MNRRTVAGLALMASIVLHIASSFFWPAGSEGSAGTQLAAAAAHPGAMAAAALADVLSWVLMVPAFVALWQEVRGRGATLVGLGAWGGVLGVLGSVGGGVLNLVTIDLGRTPGGLAAFQAIKDDGLLAAVVVLPILLGLVALVLLLAGAARAGLGGWWLPSAGGIAVVADQLTAEAQSPLVVSAAFLPMAAALVVVGVRLLSGRVTERAPATVPATV